MKRTVIFTVLMITAGILFGQDTKLFVPKELKKAYNAGTRSLTGEPGENYFQNHSSYVIEAEFDPETGLINGTEEIVYTNNSPDTLQYIVVRLYMNFFKRGIERDFSIPNYDLHDGVELKNVKVNGRKLNEPEGPRLGRDMGTVQLIRLQNPILPQSTASVSLGWEVQLPQKISIRMGQYGENNWFVAYWYPQISVYDDISGWDTHQFTGSAEFYNDFSDFDVTLTVPGNHMVWATGILQNPEDLYQSGVLERFRKAHESDSVVHIVTSSHIEDDEVLTNNTTWRFVAEKVPDFSFATSPDYLWDGTSVMVDSSENRRVFVNAAYKRNTKDFHQVAGLSREIIKLFSEKIMQAPFAYPKLTAFNGRGGMEFPMMINDGDADSFEGTVHLTAHEIGHNYFPFYVMTNESYYAFMDEGLVSFLPRLAEEYILENYEPVEGLVQSYEQAAGTMTEVPLMVKSYMISDYGAYRTHAYTRPGVAFHLLKDMLGEEAFNKALEAYIDRWKWKHPTPYDFFYTFEDVLNRDLTWFWKPWFFEFGYPDLAITSVTSGNDKFIIEVEKKGVMPVPVRIKVYYEDGTEEKFEENADVWKDGKSKHKIIVNKNKDIEKVELGGPTIPDAFKENNSYIQN